MFYGLGYIVVRCAVSHDVHYLQYLATLKGRGFTHMMQLTMCEEYNVYSGKVLNILYNYVY